MSVTLEIGFGKDSRATVSGNSIRDAVKKAQVFNEIPSACPVCATGTRLQYREAKGFEFYEVRCEGRTNRGAYEFHTSQLGVYKDDARELYYKTGEPWNTVRPQSAPVEEGSSPVPTKPAPTKPAPSRPSAPSAKASRPAPQQRAAKSDFDPNARETPKVARLNEVLRQARAVGITTADLRAKAGVESLPDLTDDQLSDLEVFVGENS